MEGRPEHDPLSVLQFDLGGQVFSASTGAIRIELGDGERCHINVTAPQFTIDKAKTKLQLELAGTLAQGPKGRVFTCDQMDDARKFARAMLKSDAGPLCVKPLKGHQARDVFTDCHTIA